MGGKLGILDKERLGMRPAIYVLVHTVRKSHMQTKARNELEMH